MIQYPDPIVVGFSERFEGLLGDRLDVALNDLRRCADLLDRAADVLREGRANLDALAERQTAPAAAGEARRPAAAGEARRPAAAGEARRPAAAVDRLEDPEECAACRARRD